jgi:hypothetical protein
VGSIGEWEISSTAQTPASARTRAPVHHSRPPLSPSSITLSSSSQTDRGTRTGVRRPSGSGVDKGTGDQVHRPDSPPQPAPAPPSITAVHHTLPHPSHSLPAVPTDREQAQASARPATLSWASGEDLELFTRGAPWVGVLTSPRLGSASSRARPQSVTLPLSSPHLLTFSSSSHLLTFSSTHLLISSSSHLPPTIIPPKQTTATETYLRQRWRGPLGAGVCWTGVAGALRRTTTQRVPPRRGRLFQGGGRKFW